MEQTQKMVDTIVKGIQEKKGKNITVADLRGIDGAIDAAQVGHGDVLTFLFLYTFYDGINHFLSLFHSVSFRFIMSSYFYCLF